MYLSTTRCGKISIFLNLIPCTVNSQRRIRWKIGASVQWTIKKRQHISLKVTGNLNAYFKWNFCVHEAQRYAWALICIVICINVIINMHQSNHWTGKWKKKRDRTNCCAFSRNGQLFFFFAKFNKWIHCHRQFFSGLSLQFTIQFLFATLASNNISSNLTISESQQLTQWLNTNILRQILLLLRINFTNRLHSIETKFEKRLENHYTNINRPILWRSG